MTINTPKFLSSSGLATPKEKEEGELLKRINEFMARYPAPKPFELPKEGWGAGWHVGESTEINFPPVALVDNQFAFVDTAAGTIICEDLNHPDSRVAVELARRGWTPPGMPDAAKYPNKINQPTADSVTDYGMGWNACLAATKKLNTKAGQ